MLLLSQRFTYLWQTASFLLIRNTWRIARFMYMFLRLSDMVEKTLMCWGWHFVRICSLLHDKSTLHQRTSLPSLLRGCRNDCLKNLGQTHIRSFLRWGSELKNYQSRFLCLELLAEFSFKTELCRFILFNIAAVYGTWTWMENNCTVRSRDLWSHMPFMKGNYCDSILVSRYVESWCKITSHLLILI